MTEAIKTEIEKMSYTDMLRTWRLTPFDSDEAKKFLHGEVGNYFSTIMQNKKEALKEGEHSAISKEISWEPNIKKYRVD